MSEVAFALVMLLTAFSGKTDFTNYFSTLPVESIQVQTNEAPLEETLLTAAKRMVEIKTPYRFSFPSIEYPQGDVSHEWGHCCDVIVRACRAGGIDLQQLVYEDSLVERASYIQANRYHQFARPLNRSWIHRRTSNLNLFLERFALSLPTRFDPTQPEEWQPGDIVVYKKNGRVTWHVAMVSDQWDEVKGVPKIIDAWLNPGYVSESHLLTSHGPIAGHYRLTEDFRSSLSQDHRKGAVESWISFSGSKPLPEERVVDSSSSLIPSLSPQTSSTTLPFLGLFTR